MLVMGGGGLGVVRWEVMLGVKWSMGVPRPVSGTEYHSIAG